MGQILNFQNTFDRVCDTIRMEIQTEKFFSNLISTRLRGFEFDICACPSVDPVLNSGITLHVGSIYLAGICDGNIVEIRSSKLYSVRDAEYSPTLQSKNIFRVKSQTRF